MKPLSPIANGAWFHSSKIADITSNLRGTWKDTRKHASTYNLRVTRISGKPTIYVHTCRAHGETEQHNISVDVAGTNARIAWGLRFNKYVGIVRGENTIAWIDVLTDRVDYVWNRICSSSEAAAVGTRAAADTTSEAWGQSDDTDFDHIRTISSHFYFGICKTARRVPSRNDHWRDRKSIYCGLG